MQHPSQRRSNTCVPSGGVQVWEKNGSHLKVNVLHVSLSWKEGETTTQMQMARPIPLCLYEFCRTDRFCQCQNLIFLSLRRRRAFLLRFRIKWECNSFLCNCQDQKDQRSQASQNMPEHHPARALLWTNWTEKVKEFSEKSWVINLGKVEYITQLYLYGNLFTPKHFEHPIPALLITVKSLVCY